MKEINSIQLLIDYFCDITGLRAVKYKTPLSENYFCIKIWRILACERAVNSSIILTRELFLNQDFDITGLRAVKYKTLRSENYF